MRARGPKLGRKLLLATVVAVAIGLPSVGTLAGTRATADTPSQPSSCPTSNPPNELTLGGGTPQTAQLDTAFDSPLQVALANSNGCPVTSVVGTPVTFTAPSSGAGGRFATSGTNTVTVGADLSGNASAPAFTANDTAGSYTVLATTSYGSVSFSLTNSAAGIPATITPLSPAIQSAAVNRNYARPLSVRVLDAGGNPVSGATVTFMLGTAGGGAGASTGASSAGASFVDGGAQATATTDSDGIATSPQLTANETIGTFTATATVAGLPKPAGFQLENMPGKGARLSALGNSKRTATVDHRYSQRLRAVLRDANGKPEAGATITFTLGAAGAGTGASAAGASFAGGTSTATATTGIHGIATSPSITAGTAAGTFTATATTTTIPSTARYTLTNRPGKPATVTAGIAAAETTQTGTRFAIALAVTVTDTLGNKIPGALVTFTAPASGASGTFATGAHPRTITARTDADGVAVAPPFIADSQPGGYVVLATVAHGPRTAFALVNDAR